MGPRGACSRRAGGRWARLLGAQAAGRAGRWALGNRAQGAGRAGRHDRQQGARRAQAGVRGRVSKHGAGRASGRRAGARGKVRQASGRGTAGARRGRWARGLALGCALDALGLFSIRFDSFFFPESPNEHYSL